jgi:hypothetical protein
MNIIEQIMPVIGCMMLAASVAKCLDWNDKKNLGKNIAITIVFTVILAGFFEHLKEHPLLDSDGNPQTEEPDNGWDLD